MLDGKANGCSQWFLSLRSVASGLEKPCARRVVQITFAFIKSYFFAKFSLKELAVLVF